VQSFAFQAAIAVVVNFMLIFFCFGSLMALDAQRIKERRFDIIPCVTADPEKAPQEDKVPSGAQNVCDVHGASGEGSEWETPVDRVIGKGLKWAADGYVGSMLGKIFVLGHGSHWSVLPEVSGAPSLMSDYPCHTSLRTEAWNRNISCGSPRVSRMALRPTG